MSFSILALLVLTICFPLHASFDVCDVLDASTCSGISRQSRRSSMLSLPSPSASANFNPATVSFDRGVGAEVMYHANNPLAFSLASGTGKAGAALISNSLENSFFGNRVIEIDEVYLKRRMDEKRYDSNKLNLALAGKLLSKKNFGLDAGIILKRHSEIKRVNPGAGVSTRIGPLTLGASAYYDDLFLDFKTGPNDTYQEKFLVKTYSAGVRIQSFTLDTGVIQTKYKLYDDEMRILFYSGSFRYKNFLFNLALRKETSPAPLFENDTLILEEEKNDTYAGIQYSINRHLIVGVHYNYFLLREVGLTAAVFF